jgi:hypothetical protein
MSIATVAMAAPSAPPEIKIPETELTNGLSPASVDQLKTWITFYVNAIRDAKDDPHEGTADQQAVKWREYIVGDAGYTKYEGVPNSLPYQFEFAKVYAAVAVPLLREAAPKNATPSSAPRGVAHGAGAPQGAGAAARQCEQACKEINIAIAAQKMPQTSIQDLLEVMVAHPNAGVRFYGWKGYSAAMPVILSQPAKLKTFMASLTARAPKERSPQVIAAMVRAMVMVPPPETAADAAAPRKQAANILAANWDKWCGAVMVGPSRASGSNDDAEMATAASDMVQSIQMIDRTIGQSDKDVHKDLLQALVDMAVAAARSFENADGKGKTGDADNILLYGCEDALTAVSGRDKSPIQTALKDNKAPAFFANVKTAAYGWKDDLKSLGVHDPDIPTPATAP